MQTLEVILLALPTLSVETVLGRVCYVVAHCCPRAFALVPSNLEYVLPLHTHGSLTVPFQVVDT